jgi:serine/threonine protein kinase
MSAPLPTDPLPAAELRRLHAVLDQFEAALSQSPATDLSEYLPAQDDPHYRQFLVELAKADIYFRCKTGEERLVEEILGKYPELRTNSADVVGLLWEEYQSRRRHRPPDLTEYRRRFPDLFEQLQERIATASSVMTPSPSAPAVPTPKIGPGTLRQSSPPPAPPANIGSADRLLSVGGGYRLRRRVGAGSFGEVWSAEAPGGVEVAVKIITRPLDHEEAKRELQALELIKQLRHPFLLSTQAFWPLDDRLVIVMELADGSLTDHLTRVQADGGKGGIPVGNLLTWMRESCEAIDFLHGKRVIHRDVKPANILTLGDHIKVADFGLARAQQVNPTVHKSTSGTPAYMAPELWYGDSATPASDLYALAVTYVELRLGHRLFTDSGLVQMMVSHIEGNPNLTGMEEAEADVVRRALAKDPRHRHSSCLSFWKELQQALDPVQTATEVGPGSTSLPAVPMRRSPPSTQAQSAVRYPAPPNQSSEAPAWKPPEAPVVPPVTPGWRLITLVLTAVLGAGGFAAWMAVGPARQTITEGRTGGAGGPVTNGTGGTEVPKSPVPEGYAAVQGTPLVSLPDGRRAPQQIVRTVEGESVVFQLVTPGDPKISPFYMMRDKCWERLLKAYEAREGPFRYTRRPVKWPRMSALGLVVEAYWRQAVPGFHELIPAFWVGVDDAELICQWLGGGLPTAQQWDAAGGFYERSPDVKPFVGFDWIPREGEMWLGGQGLRGLLSLRTEYRAGEFSLRAPGVGWPGPLPIGMASRDVSLFGCWDMAANGYEWTKSLSDQDGQIPFNQKTNVGVVLRGQSYTAQWPFTFWEVGTQPRLRYDGDQNSPTVDEYTTFRAALAIPAAR